MEGTWFESPVIFNQKNKEDPQELVRISKQN